jgi:capsule polysaccharide export protein KpsE/RkpR
MGKKKRRGKEPALQLRNLDEGSVEDGVAIARKDFDKQPLAALFIASALLRDAQSRSTTLSPQGFAYVQEVSNLLGLEPQLDATTSSMSRALLQLEPLIADVEALKKQMSNWRARRLLQVT